MNTYEIEGETIKSATAIKLGEIFPGVKRYKETVSNMQYPNFFITQVILTPTPAGTQSQHRIQLDYTMNVRYRIAEDTETVTNLQQQLDEVGLKLDTQFNELDLDLPVKVKNKYCTKDDGILQFFFDVTIFAIPSITKEEKMQELDFNEEVI